MHPVKLMCFEDVIEATEECSPNILTIATVTIPFRAYFRQRSILKVVRQSIDIVQYLWAKL